MIKYNYGKQNISNRDILAVNKVLNQILSLKEKK